MLTTIRRMLRGDGGLMPADRYWETRHRTQRGSFRAVADPGLSEAANDEQYAIKRRALSAALADGVPDPAGRSLLEAGCGIGLLTPFYVELGFAVTAVDFSATAIREARARCSAARFVRGRISSLDLAERFEAVAVVDVMLHIIDDAEWSDTWRALERHLGADGVLILLETLADDPSGWSPHCKPRPMNAYAAAARSVGLGIERVETIELAHEGSIKHLLTLRHER